jgi:2-phospho-L-lactate guanylyltransferase
MIVALIPVKELARGKRRLQSLLTSEERHLLSKTMLEDVLSVVAMSPRIDRTFVITSDSAAAALGRQYGTGVTGEPGRSDRASRSSGSAICRQMGAEAMLTLPLDVPQVTPDDLIRIVEQGNAASGIVLVPSRDRLGTNALLARPPDTITFRFGYDSFRAHQREAEVRDLACEVCELLNLALDIDEVEDLRLFLDQPGKTRTHELLHRLGIDWRLDVRQGA